MSSLAKMPVIDIDTHFTEPADLWTSRAPQRFKDQVLHVRPGQDGHDRWFVGDEFVHWIGPSIIDKAGEKQFGLISLRTYADMSDVKGKASDRTTIMNRTGIAAAVVYPNVVGFSAAKLLTFSTSEEIKLFHVHAYNDAIAELQRESGGRLFPQAVMPLWDLDASIKELERCREKLGLSGVAMPDKTVDFKQVPYTDPAWDRFFAACEAMRLPINFHVGTGNADFMAEPAEGYWGARPDTSALDSKAEKKTTYDPFLVTYMSSLFFLNNSKAICNLLLSGILEKYPKLKFVSVESGIGWIPFCVHALEWTIDELLGPSDRAKFKRRPREIFKDQIYASYWFENATAVDAYIKDFGADNLMFETDFPHPQCIYPNVQEKIQETLGKHDERTQRRVLYQNASELYGISVAA